MRTKGKINKGVSMVLVVSMIGIGAGSSMSPVFALDSGGSSISAASAAAQDGQSTPVNVLSQLAIEESQLDQPFSSNLNNYTATVDNSVQKITLLLKGDDQNEKITVTAQPAANGSSAVIPLQTVNNGMSGVIPLQTGANQMIISINDGTDAPNIYRLTITRKASSNNKLEDIQLSKGELSPKFDAAATFYKVLLPNGVDAVTVTPKAEDAVSVVSVNNILAADQGNLVRLPVGKSKITINVTAQNGERKTYTLDVIREGRTVTPIPVPSSSGKSYPPAPAGPAKNPSGSKGTYSKGGTNGQTGTQRNAGSHGNTGSFGMSGNSGNYRNFGRSGISGNAGSFSTSGGSGESGSSSRSGTFNMTGTQSTIGAFGNSGTYSRAGSMNLANAGTGAGGAAQQKPSTALLSSLTTSTGTWNHVFSKNEFTYHVSVANNVNTVTINGIPAYSAAAYTVDGSTNHTISLANQAVTAVPVVVTNGSDQKTYVLVFDKNITPTVPTTTSSAADNSISATQTAAPSYTGSGGGFGSNSYSGGRNSTSTSFWSWLIGSIRSFFSSL